MAHSRLADFLGFVVQCLYALALGAVLGLAFFSVPLGLPPPARAAGDCCGRAGLLPGDQLGHDPGARAGARPGFQPAGFSPAGDQDRPIPVQARPAPGMGMEAQPDSRWLHPGGAAPERALWAAFYRGGAGGSAGGPGVCLAAARNLPLMGQCRGAGADAPAGHSRRFAAKRPGQPDSFAGQQRF